MPAESAPEAVVGVSRSEMGSVPIRSDRSTGPAPGTPIGAGPVTLSGDWAAHLTGKVETVVAAVRDKAVRPVASAVRYLIFGLLALFVGSTMAVLFAVFSIRLLDNEVPVFRTRVWASYLVVAGIFWTVGLLVSLKRHSRS
ncbi:MAG: hypothetical protein ACYDGN_15220 [Acidimicrobiales bacterium]